MWSCIGPLRCQASRICGDAFDEETTQFYLLQLDIHADRTVDQDRCVCYRSLCQYQAISILSQILDLY